MLVLPADELELLGPSDESDRPFARTLRIRLVTYVDFGDVMTVDLDDPTNVAPSRSNQYRETMKIAPSP